VARVHLLIPPHGDLTQPLAGVPALTAWLRRSGIGVTQSDESILAFEYFTRPGRLEQARERVAAALRELDRAGSLGFLGQQHYLAAGKALLAAPYILRNIDAAKSVLRDGDAFFRPDRYRWATGVLRRALALVSAEFFRTRWSPGDLHMRFNYRSVAEICEAAASERENPFLEFYQAETLPRLLRTDAGVLGISVTHGPQLIPAFTLARLVRRVAPRCRIVFGGALLPHIAHGLAASPALFEWVDAFVLHEGEMPLEQLSARHLPANELASVGNLVFREPESGRIIETPPQQAPGLNELPVPDYDGLPLPLYLSPEPVLPLVVSRSCYWQRCTFCSRKGRYQAKREDRAVEEMRILRAKYNARHFYFAGDVIAPASVQRLGASIERSGLDVRWSTDLRAESAASPKLIETARRGGCREIRMGLESASDRVLGLIGKGITPDKVVEILDACRRNGIATRLSLFVGFPSETAGEAQQTIDFVRRWRDKIDSADFTYFALERGSILYDSPASFGITKIYDDTHLPLAFLPRYEVEPGPSMLEVLRRYTVHRDELDRLFADEPQFLSKAHSLLYSARDGVKREDRPAAAEAGAGIPEPGSKLRRPAHIEVLRLAYDLDELGRSVYRTDSKLNELLLTEGVSLRQIVLKLDQSEPPLPARSAWFVYNGLRDRITRLPDGLAHLLETCDGTRTAETLCRRSRGKIEAALQTLAGAGLIEAA
jgi:anaerobic magnesium-protoporphyrin IX monomethyl ester cyclase